jgi:hypothetical protein
MTGGGSGGERKINMLPPKLNLPDCGAIISVLFDTSDPEHYETLHRLRALLQEDGDIQALYEDLFVVHICAGGMRCLLP